MKAFSWAGSFDDAAAIYVPGLVLTLARNPHWICPLKPHMGSTPGSLKAKTSSTEVEIMEMLGARFPSLEKDLTSVSGCHDGILFIFNLFQILEYLGNLHSLIIL